MKLSEIKYIDLLLKAEPSDLSKIVFMEKPEIKNTNYGVVLGGISMIPERCDMALKLYNASMIEKILLSGGGSYLRLPFLKPEAVKMQEYLLTKKVPGDDIILEAKSRTTRENLAFFLKKIQELGAEEESITLITSDFHLKRSKELLEMLLGSTKKIYYQAVYDGFTDLENWSKTRKGQLIILREALLLCYYAKQKIIKDLEVGNLSFEAKKSESK